MLIKKPENEAQMSDISVVVFSKEVVQTNQRDDDSFVMDPFGVCFYLIM